MTIVYAAGVFDILHYGHIRFLQAAKALGDTLVVGLLTDEAVERYKYHRPVMRFDERWEVVKALGMIEYVVRQTDTDPTETLKLLWEDHRSVFPNILIRADDVKTPVPGQEFIESKGGIVKIVPYTKTISSTDIKKRMGCIY